MLALPTGATPSSGGGPSAVPPQDAEKDAKKRAKKEKTRTPKDDAADAEETRFAPPPAFPTAALNASMGGAHGESRPAPRPASAAVEAPGTTRQGQII